MRRPQVTECVIRPRGSLRMGKLDSWSQAMSLANMLVTFYKQKRDRAGMGDMYLPKKIFVNKT